ncbi:helix-turn-helix domain-containing protein [Vibrio misgurnus]|uniref:helix-turn-helix domain-containing protein n=1 Tax=Vibrio misgurnus TaxID=2993714 RepID=UPI0024180DDD|nr:helix-turn-helix transcriptional regulator [Vibrio sp. gvc]
MVVADHVYVDYDAIEINKLAVSGQHAVQSAAHSTYQRPSATEIFDLINYRSGQHKYWTHTKTDFHDVLVEVSSTDTLIKSPQQNLLVKRLNELKSSLGLADEELASILKTTRKTLHNWQQGSTKPNKTKLLRLVAQHKLLSEWISNGYPDIATLDIEDKSQVLNKLQQDDVDISDVLYFGSGLMLTSDFDAIDDPFA